jgi:hypothetical protein
MTEPPSAADRADTSETVADAAQTLLEELLAVAGLPTLRAPDVMAAPQR